MERVTMKDIARVMGVSVMTVSNAFNRPDQLSGELRERILQRATKMGYTGPDAAARHLRSGRTNSYAVVFEEKLSYAFTDPFSALWLAAFAREMERHRASVMLISVPASDEEALAAIQDVSVDGVVGLCGDQPAFQLARRRGLPTVVCSLSSDEAKSGDHIVIDDYQAGKEVSEYVRRLGHERVIALVETGMREEQEQQLHVPTDFAMLLGEYKRIGFFDTWFRLRGISDGLAGAEIRVVAARGNSRASGREAGSLILDRRDRPTAVVAVSDTLALGFMDACRDRGLVPGTDISVTGFDDLPEAAAAGLTTVRQPIEDKGRLAAQLLLDPLRQPRQIMLPHRLIVRASTQPAPLPSPHLLH